MPVPKEVVHLDSRKLVEVGMTLSHAEFGCLMRMILWSAAHGVGIRDLEHAEEIFRAKSEQERRIARAVLTMFFEPTQDGWYSKETYCRADA